MARDAAGDLDRRDFLIGGAGVVGAGVLGATGARADETAPRVRGLRPLGRTGIQMSDISFGSSRMANPKVVRHAFERGVNYFDGAEDYKRGASEEALGEALHDVRDQVTLTSKTQAGAKASQAEMMRALEGSLKRLRTDRVDIYFNHAVNDVDRLRNEEWHAFTERAKQQGKIRFRGMSGHAGRLVECLGYGLDHDLLDVILVAYNFGQDPAFYQRLMTGIDFVALQPDLPPVLERAHREGVGVVAMKTLFGGRANDLRPYERPGGTFAQAAFRWVLSNPNVDGLIISMKSPEQIDEYLRASGARAVSQHDLRLLGRYALLNGGRSCQLGCGRCVDRCPAGIDISEVLRTRMYDVDYRDPELARREYSGLARDASPCLSCDGTPCAGACPNGIPIARFTRDAARRLG